MTEPTAVYKLGPEDNLLALPGVRFGSEVSSGYTIPAAVNETMAGKRTRDVLGTVKRTWSFQWDYLLLAEARDIETVIRGASPLWFFDPLDASGVNVPVVLGSYSRSFVSPTEVNASLELLEA